DQRANSGARIVWPKQTTNAHILMRLFARSANVVGFLKAGAARTRIGSHGGSLPFGRATRYRGGKVGRRTGRRGGARRSVRVARMIGQCRSLFRRLEQSVLSCSGFRSGWGGVWDGMITRQETSAPCREPGPPRRSRKGGIASDWSSRQHVSEPESAKPHGASPGFA